MSYLDVKQTSLNFSRHLILRANLFIYITYIMYNYIYTLNSCLVTWLDIIYCLYMKQIDYNKAHLFMVCITKAIHRHSKMKTCLVT